MVLVMFIFWMEGSFLIDLLYFYLILIKLLDKLEFIDKLNVYIRILFIILCFWLCRDIKINVFDLIDLW